MYPWFRDILFVIAFFCVELSVSKSDTASLITPSDSSKQKLVSSTNVALSSEGGPLVPDAKGMTLLQGNYSIPVMSKDEGKNKVVARKGVVYSEGATKSQETSVSTSNENTTNKVSTSGDKPNTLVKPVDKPTSDIRVVKGNDISNNKTVNSTNEEKKAETPRKPLVLEAVKLEKMTVKTTVTNNQTKPPKSSYIPNTNNPGMVMPIVITILLVPMFVVLGYMALRRGQEAWKNRHYKRMDFLLDGMYND